MPTLMIFTDDPENIAEPNQVLAQQNECSTSHCANGSHDFKESSEDDSTNKRFHLLYFSDYFFLSSFFGLYY